MSRYITVRLTMEQAQELLYAADNGYGDGDFYQANQGDEYPQDAQNKREEKLFLRARQKVLDAMRGL